MERYFRKENGERVNVIEHCKEVLSKQPNTKILIGTDSQNSKCKRRVRRGKKPATHYSTVIVFRYGLRGAHYIYRNIEVPRIRDLFTRLFKECEMSLEIAEYITKNSAYKVSAIELDFNDFKKTKSTPLISATRGWCESQGYQVVLKSGEMIACKAADHICRRASDESEDQT